MSTVAGLWFNGEGNLRTRNGRVLEESLQSVVYCHCPHLLEEDYQVGVAAVSYDAFEIAVATERGVVNYGCLC